MSAAILLPNWITDEHAITLATWALVLVTFFLVIATAVLWWDGVRKGSEQRERWNREDEQHALDRDEERSRWRREDELRAVAIKQEILTRLISEFSSSEMKRARTDFAHNLFAWTAIIRYHVSVGPVGFAERGPALAFHGEQKIIEFFSHVERMISAGEIDVSGVNRDFGDYVFRFVEATSGRVPGKLDVVRSLNQKLKAYRAANTIPDPDSDIDARKSYWYYAIDRNLVPKNS